jgi:hypothetical protein
MFTDLQLCEAALVDGEPTVGSSDLSHEVRYKGYKRVPVLMAPANLHEVAFPPCDQDEELPATHVVVVDGRGVIVAARPITDDMVRYTPAADCGKSPDCGKVEGR